MRAQEVAAESGVLKVFNAAGVFNAADVHVARRVAALSGAQIGDDELIALALAVRAVRLGSTCAKLDEIADIVPEHDDEPEPGREPGAAGDPPALPWPDPAELAQTLRTSPLVTGCPSGPLRPLAIVDSDDGPLLYLRKYFRQEQTIREILAERRDRVPEVDPAALAAALDAVFGPAGDSYDRQRAAAALAATSWTTVLAGGPGTGKTFTVARILAVMEELYGGDVRIGLCAPTGRAAAQIQSAVNDPQSAVTLRSEPMATTVHKLLRWRPDGSFGRGPGNRLPYDVVVVDETSMMAVSMMSRLLESLRPDTRLILVGDPHQLSSVDAGAVLADLVERADRAECSPPEAFTAVAAPPPGEFDDDELLALSDGVLTLRHVHRHGGQIAKVAEAIQQATPDTLDRVVDLIAGPGAEQFAADATGRVHLVDPADVSVVSAEVVAWASALQAAAASGDAEGSLTALMTHRVLCAHRDGRFGASGWSKNVTEWITEELGPVIPAAGWYVGEPILVNKNDPTHRVFNGDTGVVVDDGGALSVVFSRGRKKNADAAAGASGAAASEQEILRLHPSQLADSSRVYAMTIHRSQGSQFDAVTVVLPEIDAELLTRELLYTAVTRAKKTVYIVGTPETLRAAVARRVQRASGLRSAVRELGRV
ncbi:MAG: exodeoxyribonuclease V subunit alpha [Gordonia sp. (in: high G+C Gram-positive bacteria)]